MNSVKTPILFLLASVLHYVSAQTTSASCQSGFEWMANSLQQSPCLVAAYLGHQCTPNNSFNVPPLVERQQYLPPNQQQANDCQCSSVYYSVLSGCAACQGSSLTPFTTWTQSCPSNAITFQSYPLTTPNDTRIPSWAFLPFKDGVLDINAARQNATGQDSYGEPQHFSVGVIIGLVLGSVAVLILVGAAIWMYCRLQSAKARGFDALNSVEASKNSNKGTPSQNSTNEPPSYSNSNNNNMQEQRPIEQDKNQSQKPPIVRYDKIEGPPRPPRKFLFFPKRTTTVVKSYRPGLNFDLDKGRRGDLLELSENNGSKRSFSRISLSASATHLASPPPTASSGGSSTLLTSSTSSDSPSHPAKLSKKQKPYQEHYEHYPLPLHPRRDRDQVEPVAESITSTPSLSQFFSRPKEVKPLKGDVRVDLAAETEDGAFTPRLSESNIRPRSELNDISARAGSGRIR